MHNFSEYKRTRQQNASFHSEHSFHFDDAARLKRGTTKPDQIFVLNKDPDDPSVPSEPDTESIGEDSRVIVPAGGGRDKPKLMKEA